MNIIARYNRNEILKSFILPIICWLIWIIPLLIIDKEYIFFTYIFWLFIPILFTGWQSFKSKKFHILKHLFVYPIINILFGFFIFAYCLCLQWNIFEPSRHIENYGETFQAYAFTLIFTFPLVFVIYNILVLAIEKKKLTLKKVLKLFYTSLFVFIFSWIISLAINYMLILFIPERMFNLGDKILNEIMSNPFKTSFYPMNWIYNGSIVFSSVLYETLFFKDVIKKA